jgi:uncharacterized protein YbjT (DUF2867 family)
VERLAEGIGAVEQEWVRRVGHTATSIKPECSRRTLWTLCTVSWRSSARAAFAAHYVGNASSPALGRIRTKRVSNREFVLMNSSPILVIGSTGKTGRRIVQRLHSAGYQVRAGSRSARPAFDWYAPDQWAQVLAGVRTAYVAYAPDLAAPGAADAIETFASQARNAGLERLVLLSGRGETNAEHCERILLSSGISCTRLRASWFFQNFSEGQLLPSVLAGQLALPAGDVLEPFIDADDIADVAFAALTDPKHDGKLYELTGPRLLTFADAARAITEASRRPVTYTSIPASAFREALTAEVGASVADMLTAICEEVFDGRNARLGHGVEQALGRPARDFADYCRACASSGVWSA